MLSFQKSQHAFHNILEFLETSDVVVLQGLQRKFYNKIVPQILAKRSVKTSISSLKNDESLFWFNFKKMCTMNLSELLENPNKKWEQQPVKNIKAIKDLNLQEDDWSKNIVIAHKRLIVMH
jgi:hypothetical protein